MDEWILMPNHLHGILFFCGDVDERPETPRQGPSSGSLGTVVGTYKSVTTRRINRLRKTPGMPVWQRNYYERVIRNEREWNAIRQYIRDNPAHWAEDRENPDRRA